MLDHQSLFPEKSKLKVFNKNQSQSHYYIISIKFILSYKMIYNLRQNDIK
jgi:hypothetical protein